MKQKAISFLLVVGLLFTSLVAHAVDYDIWVQGVRVTSSNASNVLGNGSVSYDASNKVLYLNGAVISNTNGPGIRFGISSTNYSNAAFQIAFGGTNTISAPNNDAISIYGNNIGVGIVTLTDNSSLTINGQWGIWKYGTNAKLALYNDKATSSINITSTQSCIKVDNLILEYLSGNNNKITSGSGYFAIICNDIISGLSFTQAFGTCSTSLPKKLTLNGRVKITSNRIDLNGSSSSTNYIKTPSAACIADSVIYDVATGNIANKIVIDNGVTRHHVWVKGVEVTSANASNILGDNTASYNASTGTLTLNNFNVSMGDKFYSYDYSGYVGLAPTCILFSSYANSTRKINLQGSNRIDMKLGDSHTNLIFNGGSRDLTFEGSGSLVAFTNRPTPSGYGNMIVLQTSGNKTHFNGTGRIALYIYANNVDYISSNSMTFDANNYQAYWSNTYNTSQSNMTVETSAVDIKGSFGNAGTNTAARRLILEPAYNLYVADVRVDNFNKDDIADRSNKITGTVSYAPTTKTLSLNNATINYDGTATENDNSIIRNYGALGSSIFNINLTGTNNLTLTKNTTSNLYGFYYGITTKGTGSLNLTINNTNGGTVRGIDGDTKIQGSGVITITTPNAGNNIAIDGQIDANSGYLMYSGTTATTATVKNPIPQTCTDKYIRFERNTAAPLVITDGPELDIPASVVGKPITQILLCDNVTGGTAPYTYSATGLPAGITIGASSGIISGTPTTAKAAGTATITVRDNLNVSATVTIAYGTISAALTFTDNAAMDIPASTVGIAIANINCKTYVSGGKQPYTFSAFNLPTGITINSSTGVISGTPTTAQPAGQAKIYVTDNNNDKKEVTINYGVISEPVGVETINNDELLVWSNDGFIGCSADEYTIFNVNGTDVTAQNGNLTPGSYIVRSANSVAKVTVK